MNADDDIALVPYEPRWLHDLVRMWRASFELGVGIVDPHPIEEQEAFFVTRVVPHQTVRVAMIDGRLVGFVAASPRSVAHLYVRAGLHRRGIGSTMLAWAKATSQGSLWLHTFARNTGARAFYERHGFVAVAHGFEPEWKLDDVR